MINTVKAPAARRTELAAARTDIAAAMERKAPGGVGAGVLLSTVGWYRVAKFKAGVETVTQGAHGGTMLLSYSTSYSEGRNTSGLLSVNIAFDAGTITPLGWVNADAANHISKARLVYNAADATMYVELYYAVAKTNTLRVYILGGELYNGARWELLRPMPTSGTPTVYATADLTQPPMTQQETGTWTPILYGTTTAGSPTYALQWGVYIRQGRLVWINGRIVLNALGGIAGQVCIRGLPFALAAECPYAPIYCPVAGVTSDTAKPVAGILRDNDLRIALYRGQDNILSSVSMLDITELYFSGTYLI